MKDRSALKGARVLVTGGAGVIGRELLVLLAQEEAEVLCVDRNLPPDLSTGKIDCLQVNLAKDDLRVCKSFKPEVIVHLAASFERSKESAGFMETNWEDNLLVSHRVARLAWELPVLRTFVFASSYLIYAPSLYLSTTLKDDACRLLEDDRAEPRNLTGSSKYFTEKELDFIRDLRSPGLRVVHARIYRVYGKGSKDVISRWVRSALKGEPLDLYNSANRFDFVYAGDVAEGLVRLSCSERAKGVVNLGSGIASSIDDVVDALRVYVPVKARDRGAVESFEASFADTSRLRALTGWVPPTGLKEGIGRIIHYEKALVQASGATEEDEGGDR